MKRSFFDIVMLAAAGSASSDVAPEPALVLLMLAI